MSLVDDRLDTPGTSRLLSETGDVVDTLHIHLIPAPSADPEDPLNWSAGRKYLNLGCVFLYTIATGVLSSALYSVYTPLSEDKGLTLDQLNSAQGYMYLFIGLACLITQPAALAFGKRPTYIISSFATGLVNIWAVYGSGNGQWIAGRLLVGLSLSPQFTLVECSIADVFFMHERAYKLGLYCVSLYIGVTLGPLLSGYVYDGLGWKAIIWLASGFCMLTGVFLFFFLEETSYIRDPVVEYLAHNSDAQDTFTKGEKQPGEASLQERDLAPPPPALKTKWPGPKFWKFKKPHPHAAGIMARGFLQPILLSRLPIVLFCAWIFGMYQVYFNFIAALTSGILSVEPYNFSSSSVGLTFLGPMLSSIPGAMFGGRIADMYALRKARKNHGIAEAEDKLELFFVPMIGMVVGLLMMGLGPYYGAHWIVFVLGTSIVNFVGPIATVLGLAYAFDCFHSIHPNQLTGPNAAVQECAPYLLNVILIGMTLAFGFGYAITPWCFTWGLKNFAISAALTSIVVNGVAYLFVWKGKAMRREGEAYYRKVINY